MAATSDDVNQWEVSFRFVATTRDYRGPGRPIAGEQRLPLQRAAHLLLADKWTSDRRERFLVRTIEAWRLAALDDLVPHPGMIPNGAKSLQDVPGWEEADYPPSDLFRNYRGKLGMPGPSRLPHRRDTVQCVRVQGKHALDPEDYETMDEIEPKRSLLLFVSIGEMLTDTTDWTEADITVWREQVLPMMTVMLDHIPDEVWTDDDNERKEA